MLIVISLVLVALDLLSNALIVQKDTTDSKRDVLLLALKELSLKLAQDFVGNVIMDVRLAADLEAAFYVKMELKIQ